MKELMVQVERVVRPIHASNLRKSRMREELLQHLEGIYEEEREHLGDKEQALKNAIERFGDPVELNGELQQSVPRIERRLFVPIPFLQQHMRRQTGESAVRYELRMAACSLFAYFLFCCVLIVVVMATRGIQNRPIDLTKIQGFLPLIYVNFVIVAIVFILLNDGMRKALGYGVENSRSLIRGVSYGVLSSVVAFISGLGFGLTINLAEGHRILTAYHLVWLSLFAGATPFLLVVYSWISGLDIRRYERWERLEISE